MSRTCEDEELRRVSGACDGRRGLTLPVGGGGMKEGPSCHPQKGRRVTEFSLWKASRGAGRDKSTEPCVHGRELCEQVPAGVGRGPQASWPWVLGTSRLCV